MRMLDLILKKRNKKVLTQEEFNFIAQGTANETIPDYQLSAFLMACFLNPLNEKETAYLTKAMAFSGKKLIFKNLKQPIVDKHSTGGVGDGISLALAPLATCCGLCVPMMSGRGLGHTGGTLDKLESIKGFQVRIPEDKIYKQMQKLNVCMFGQTKELAPADKKLYSLRDATATVETRPLIIASILSKKYAEGINALFIDVKYGSGAFMKTYKDAKLLAKGLVKTAKLLGLKCRALITNMNTPLGRAVGNGNEVLQTIEILKGNKEIAPDFYELLIESTAQMLVVSGKEKDLKKAKQLAITNLENGSALQKFKDIILAQGGTNILDNPKKHLKNAKFSLCIKADKKGYITELKALPIGQASVLLGAGRSKMEDKIIEGAGIWLDKKLGEQVKKDEVIAHLYAEDKKCLEEAKKLFLTAVKIGSKKPKLEPIIKELIK